MGSLTGNFRVFHCVFVFGLAIIFLAILMVFSGTNAQADVIVDQAGGGDYLTIQEGIDNAIPGENVFVWDGSYNENITIDKNLQLIGNGSATTVIDGFGTMNNIINITAEGVVITGFNITNSGNRYGIWANVGGFSIHDNIFYTQNLLNWAIYMDVNRLNPGSTTVGDIIVDNNEVIGTHGFYFNIWLDEPLPGSDFIFGDTIISNNTLHNTQTGIAIDRYTVFNMNQGSITWGDILVKDNYINCSGSGYDGIFFWGIFWNITDVNIDLGKMDFSGNNITAQSNGIYIDWWDFCDGFYGNTIALTQDTQIYDNDIISQSGYGLLLQTDIIGNIIYDSTSITTGDFYIYSNNITSLSAFPGYAGIHFKMSEIAQEVYNDSSVNFGNISINSNFIDANSRGIYFNILNSFGSETYDNALVTIGDVQLTNNEILSVNEGVYISFNNVGNIMYDYASATFGSYYINNNNITSSNSDGIYFYTFAVASSMHNETSFSIGDIVVNGNNILNAQNYGINTYFHESGWNLYDNSHVMFGNVLITDNNVTSNNDGIEYMLSSLAYDMHGTSSFSFGSSIVQDNIIEYTGSEGIDVHYVFLGTEMHDSASVTISNTIIDSNNITATINGLVVSMDSLARDMHNDTTFLMGDFTIGPNTINSTSGYGIIFQLFMSAYTMDGSASASFGSFSISGNNLLSAGIGIHTSLSSVGYEMSDLASASIWGLEIDFNNITSGDQAILILVDFMARNVHNDSIFGMGDFTINHNAVNSTNNVGIEFHMQSSAYNLTGNAVVTFSGFLFNDNVINSTGNGFNLYWYDFAFVMEGDSYFQMGSLEVMGNSIVSDASGIDFVEMGFLGNYLTDTSIAVFSDFIVEDNTINSSGDGVKVNAYDWGETLSGNSSVSFGNFSVSYNIIESGYQGIFFQFEPAGYDMYDMATFEMGSLDVSNNTIISGKDPAATDSYGICFRTRQVGFYINNETQVIIGPILVNDNTVTVLFGTNSDGIRIYWIDSYGRFMHDTASFTMNGNLEVCRNTVNTTNGDDGIYCDVYENGYDLHDDSTASFGNFLFNDNIINSTGDGIYINSIQMCGSYLYNNSIATFGDIEINRNQIIAGSVPSGSNRGIYFYFYENCYDVVGNTQVYFGHVQLNDNTITCYDSDGIYVDAFYEIGANYMQDNAYFEMGNFEIQGNWIDANESGIYIWEFAYLGYEIYDNSTAVFGDFLFDGNTIFASEHGIYINAYDWGYTMTGTSSATFGDFSVSDNIIESGYQGIYFQFEYAGYDMHDMSTFEMGSIMVFNNTVISGEDPVATDGYGILFHTRYVGYEMHNESQSIVGPILVNENTVTVIFGTNADGIYINWISDYGAYMYDTATFTMNGDIEVCRNKVNTTNGDNGIFCDVYNLGTYLFGDNIASYGNNLFNDNIIVDAYNDGLRILVNAIGYYTYGDSSVTIGNVELSNNDIQIEDGSYYSSIDLDLYDLGAIMYDGSIFSMGHFQMNDNTIINPDGMGLYIEAYRLGYEMYNNSNAYFGNFEFLRNNITSHDEGITLWYLQNFLANMHNNTSAFFGDFLINDNIINTTSLGSDGIYIEKFQYVGYQMYDQSYAEFGNFECNGNEVDVPSSSAYGIYFCPYRWASYMYDDATFVVDDFNFMDNTINTIDNGIYWEPDYFGAYMYGNSTAIIGNNFITGNEINVVNGYGLYAWWWYDFAYDMHNNSICTVGSTIIMNNIINVTGTGGFSGIWTGPYDSGENVYDGSTAVFGDYIVDYNTVNTVDTSGIEFSIYRVGYNMNGFASVTVGNISVSNNIINSTNGNGIYITETYQNGNELYNNAKVTMGRIEFCDNHIEAGVVGINYNSIYGFGSYMYNDSMFEMGDFNLTGNTINSSINGILFNPHDFGSYMYNDSMFEMGDFNFIDNVIKASMNGISFEPWNFGAYMTGQSNAIIGSNLITDNIINVEDDYGLYAWWWYMFAYEMYDNSTCIVGDSVIMYNVINVTGTGSHGIYTGPYDSGDNLFGNSTATFGDYIVSHNTVNANSSYGIEFDIHDTGSEMYDNSNATFGQFQINDNNITAPNGAGLFVDINRLAYNLYNTSYLSIDDIIIMNNNIIAQTIGIEILYWQCGGLHNITTADISGIQILGNWVNSGISAFNYTTTNTPFNNDLGAIQVWGDVVLDGNDFDAGMFGVVFDWRSPDPTVPQPEFHIRNTNIHDGLGGSIGFLLVNITSAYGERVTIDTFDYGIFTNYSSVHYMFNSSLANCAVLDIGLYSESYLFMINSTFDNSSVFFEDFDSLLEVAWYMHVTVQSQVALPVPGANVTVADMDGTEIFNGTADANGQVLFLICMEYQENITGIIKNFNDYTANADKGGSFGSAIPNPIMNMTKVVIITLADITPPTIFSDNSDTNGTTGDPFYFEINASDDMGIVSVHINFRFDGVGPYTNRTMNGTGPYWFNEILPTDYVGFLEYYFTAVDSGGFWVNTTPTTAPITDNDPPTIITDNSDTIATTGETFNFNLDTTDNINISEVHVVWWFGSDPQTDDNMTGTGPYDFSIPVPLDSLDTLHYYFRVVDDSGNWVIGPQVNITVADNDEPTYTWVLEPITGSAGDSITVSLLATDNIGITNYTINVNGSVYDMVKDGDYYNFTIDIPLNATEDFTYFVTFLDNTTNSNTTLGTTVTLVSPDIEPPNLVWVLQPTTGTTGESILVSLIVTDNIGVTYYKIDIDGTMYDLIKDGDYYNLTIDIPIDSIADITYTVYFNDTANNPNSSLPITITVTDDDAPTYNWVLQPDTANTGDTMVVSLEALDNIGVTSYKINIDGTEYDLTNEGDFYNYTINIPSDSTASITYNITFTDAAGNPVTTPDTTITVTSPDNEAPNYFWVLNPNTGTTGDPVHISLVATDNVGITIYQIDIDGTQHDLVKDGDYYNYTFIISSDSTTDVTYFVYFNDDANNANATPDTTIIVTDNDAPTGLVDTSDSTAATGGTFTFEVDATDNIGIHEVHVVYWFGFGTSINATMNGTGPYTFNITIPSDSLDTLHYTFTISDAAGNWLVVPAVNIIITDDQAATLSNEASDESGKEGEVFTFQIDASDNVGISQVRVAYWFGDDESQKQFITLSATDGTYSGSFTPEQSGTMNYYFEVTDNGGNTIESDDYTVEVASKAKEDEGVNPVLFIIPVIVIIILLLFFLLTRKKKEEEVPPEVIEGEEDLLDEDLLEGEELEEGVEPEEDLEEGEEIEGFEEGEEEIEGEFEDGEPDEELGDSVEEDPSEDFDLEEETEEGTEPEEGEEGGEFEEEPAEESEPVDTQDEGDEQQKEKSEEKKKDELDEILDGL